MSIQQSKSLKILKTKSEQEKRDEDDADLSNVSFPKTKKQMAKQTYGNNNSAILSTSKASADHEDEVDQQNVKDGNNNHKDKEYSLEDKKEGEGSTKLQKSKNQAETTTTINKNYRHKRKHKKQKRDHHHRRQSGHHENESNKKKRKKSKKNKRRHDEISRHPNDSDLSDDETDLGWAHEPIPNGSNDVRHLCCICEQYFVSPIDVIIHERQHLEIQPYHCKYCRRQFFAKSDAYRHIRNHQAMLIGVERYRVSPFDVKRGLAVQKHVLRREHDEIAAWCRRIARIRPITATSTSTSKSISTIHHLPRLVRSTYEDLYGLVFYMFTEDLEIRSDFVGSFEDRDITEIYGPYWDFGPNGPKRSTPFDTWLHMDEELRFLHQAPQESERTSEIKAKVCTDILTITINDGKEQTNKRPKIQSSNNKDDNSSFYIVKDILHKRFDTNDCRIKYLVKYLVCDEAEWVTLDQLYRSVGYVLEFERKQTFELIVLECQISSKAIQQARREMWATAKMEKIMAFHEGTKTVIIWWSNGMMTAEPIHEYHHPGHQEAVLYCLNPDANYYETLQYLRARHRYENAYKHPYKMINPPPSEPEDIVGYNVQQRYGSNDIKFIDHPLVTKHGRANYPMAQMFEIFLACEQWPRRRWSVYTPDSITAAEYTSQLAIPDSTFTFGQLNYQWYEREPRFPKREYHEDCFLINPTLPFVNNGKQHVESFDAKCDRILEYVSCDNCAMQWDHAGVQYFKHLVRFGHNGMYLSALDKNGLKNAAKRWEKHQIEKLEQQRKKPKYSISHLLS